MTIATRANTALIEAVHESVRGIAVKVDWLYEEAQNGGVPAHMSISPKVKVALIAAAGTMMSGVAAALVAAFRS